jgi:uncharacterized membrane protein YvbJ
MSFCPKCGAHHDPNYPCADRAGEMMQDMGVERRSKMSKEEFKTLEKRADRSMLKILLIVVVGFLLFLTTIIIIQRYI